MSVVVVGLVAAALLAAVHLTQGTADVGVGDLVRLLLGGSGAEQPIAVVVASRIPRLLAGCLVGVALGLSGAALQSVARNPLAAPDLLGVDSGAYMLLVLAIALRWSLPVPFAGGLAFLGGLAAAALVLALAFGRVPGRPAWCWPARDRDGPGRGDGDAAAAVPRPRPPACSPGAAAR